ncbi:MAG: hypothetical protein HKN50_07025 [Gammaproteobacteria bacterium]|nr:hypothetical protein [Gammaproteobacteria bacterium]
MATHNWIPFLNPRTGSVVLEACSVCGVTRGSSVGMEACKLVDHAHQAHVAGDQVRDQQQAANSPVKADTL